MTHRRTLFAALMLLGAGGTFAQSGFTITGRVPGVKDSTVVRLMNIEDEGRRGKLVTQGICLNGGFRLEGRVTSPTLCRVEILGTHAYEDGQSFQTETETCMMVENVPMTMEVAHLDSLPLTYEYGHSPLEKEMNATVSGGTEQTAYVAYRRALHDAELRTWRLDRMCLDLKFDKAGCADSLPVWQARLRSMQQEVAERTDAFIRSHPQASISACLVEQKLKKPFTLSADEIDAWVTCVQGMPDTVRLSRIRELAEAAKVYATGQQFKDFVLTDTLKQIVALSVARRPGVYTLVDFWASWCAPCRASIPHLKELYKAQSGRLDILSVSVDRKEADWRKAMREEQMPWRQYTVTPEVSKQLGDLYQLHSIPFLLLLDPDGRIVVGTHDPDEVDAALEQAMAASNLAKRSTFDKHAVAEIRSHPNGTPPSPEELFYTAEWGLAAPDFNTTFILDPDTEDMYVLMISDRTRLEALRDFLKDEIDPVTKDFRRGGKCAALLEINKNAFERLPAEDYLLFRLAIIAKEAGGAVSVAKSYKQDKSVTVYGVKEVAYGSEGQTYYEPVKYK